MPSHPIAYQQGRPIRWGAMAQAAVLGFGSGTVVGGMASFMHGGRVNPQAAFFLGSVLAVGGAFRASH